MKSDKKESETDTGLVNETRKPWRQLNLGSLMMPI